MLKTIKKMNFLSLKYDKANRKNTAARYHLINCSIPPLVKKASMKIKGIANLCCSNFRYLKRARTKEKEHNKINIQ